MANPFAQGGGPSQFAGYDMNAIRNAYASLKSGNMQQSVIDALSRNPRMAPVMNLLRQGRNPEYLFREMARQRGIDPDAFIREITKK